MPFGSSAGGEFKETIMANVRGLLDFIGQAPGQLIGGLLGPSPLPPGMAGQLPPGYQEQARQQAVNNMALQLLAGPKAAQGARFANAAQVGQEGYRGSLVDMLRLQEMQRLQAERDANKAREGRLNASLQGIPGAENLSPRAQEELILSSMKPDTKDSQAIDRRLSPEEVKAANLPEPGKGRAWFGKFKDGVMVDQEIKGDSPPKPDKEPSVNVKQALLAKRMRGEPWTQAEQDTWELMNKTEQNNLMALIQLLGLVNQNNGPVSSDSLKE